MASSLNKPRVPDLRTPRGVLFDMNLTFMFSGDRLDEDQDFYSTYRSLGGTRLSDSEVRNFIMRCYSGMATDYDDPARIEDFPSLHFAMAQYAAPPESEAALLERTFALHELGSIPDWAVDAIRAIAATHMIGIVSNIWSPKQLWIDELERAGIAHLFSVMEFSSDGRSIKPSPALFEAAIGKLGLQAHEVLFVGDSLDRDVIPAASLGMATAWISPGASSEIPDFTIPSIAELLSSGACPDE